MILLVVSFTVLHVVLCLCYILYFHLLNNRRLHYATVYLTKFSYLSCKSVTMELSWVTEWCRFRLQPKYQAVRRASRAIDERRRPTTSLKSPGGQRETPAVHVGAWSIVVRLNTGPDRTGRRATASFGRHYDRRWEDDVGAVDRIVVWSGSASDRLYVPLDAGS